jgi:hypothetical protein
MPDDFAESARGVAAAFLPALMTALAAQKEGHLLLETIQKLKLINDNAMRRVV